MPPYGIASTGNIWRFLQLQNNTLFIDCREHYIDRVRIILSILERMVNTPSSPRYSRSGLANSTAT